MTSRKRTAGKQAGSPTPRAVARVFWSGRSQAIRLPKEFRVDGRDLLIARRGKALVLEPRNEPVDEKGWPRSFWRLFGALPDDFDLGDRAQRPERKSPIDG